MPVCRAVLVLLFATMLLTACHSQSASADAADASASPHIIAQWSGQYGGGSAPQNRALRTTQEWDAFWQQVEGERPRPLDPSHEMAVAIQLGEKRSGGFSAELLGTKIENGKLVVEYRELTPPPDAMVIQVLTSPWIAALLPVSDLPVEFRRVAGGGAGAKRSEK